MRGEGKCRPRHRGEEREVRVTENCVRRAKNNHQKKKEKLRSPLNLMQSGTQVKVKSPFGTGPNGMFLVFPKQGTVTFLLDGFGSRWGRTEGQKCGCTPGHPLGPTAKPSPPQCFFFPKKSPPSIPFAAVLLKKLGKTTMSRGRGHSWRWRRGETMIYPLLCCSCSRTRTRY